PGLDLFKVRPIRVLVEIGNLPEPARAAIPQASAKQIDVEIVERRIVGFVEVLADERLKQLRGAVRVDHPTPFFSPDDAGDHPLANLHLVKYVLVKLESRIVAGEIAIRIDAGRHDAIESALRADAVLNRVVPRRGLIRSAVARFGITREIFVALREDMADL